MSDYVVLHRAEDMSQTFNIGELEGRWFDLDDLDKEPETKRGLAHALFDETGLLDAVFVPTGRLEQRRDGMVAEVWECRV